MSHFIPTSVTDRLTCGPSATKITQVANLQNYIQGLLGDTHHTFLQGSYKNDTAISDINDVDIVAVRISTYSTVHTGLRFDTQIPWEEIFSEIENKLRSQSKYKWTVTRGDKCIKVRGAFDADVVPAVQVSSDPKSDPIVVYSFRTGVEKINSPRQHYENGVAKSKSTNGQYKPTVRMFKNWVRNHFGNNKTAVSSFKVEALVHGLSDASFLTDPVANFIIGADEILKKVNTRSVLPIRIPSVCGCEDITQDWSLVGRGMFTNQLQVSLDSAGRAYKATSATDAERHWRAAFNF